MDEILFRCSSISKIMTDPRTKADGILSVGAKTYIRELAAQALFGVEFEFSSRETEKGTRCEPLSIDLLNRVRGTSLVKNTQRRSNGFITGECDVFNATQRRGHDVKTPWSIKTFPITVADCEDKLYDWQARGYMVLWDADEWSVDYCLINTPDDLIGWEPQHLHFVDHIPEHHRVTSWVIKRDAAKEAAMVERIAAARDYFRQVLAEFDRTHQPAREMEAA